MQTHKDLDIELLHVSRGSKERCSQRRTRYGQPFRFQRGQRFFGPLVSGCKIAASALYSRQLRQRGCLAAAVVYRTADLECLIQACQGLDVVSNFPVQCAQIR